MIRIQSNPLLSTPTPPTSLQCKMQTKDSIHSIHPNQTSLQQFDTIELIIKYATICCNESISYFSEYFSNLLIIANIQKYYHRLDTMNGPNNVSIKNSLNHININNQTNNNTNNHHHNHYNDIITTLFPEIASKIQQHYSFVATEMIGNITHQQSLLQIHEIIQCLFTKFLKNCMECMITTNDNHQIVLLPDFIFNNVYPSYSNIENRFESILNKLCHKHGMMAPINIPKFDINQQILLHDAMNIAMTDHLPSTAPLLSCNRSRSLSSDSVPLQHSMNNNNGVNNNNNNNDTSSICAVFEGETGRVNNTNNDSFKNNNNNNNNNNTNNSSNFQLNQLNHMNTNFNSGHQQQQQQQISNYGQIARNNNNNNNNNNSFNPHSFNTVNPGYIMNRNSNTNITNGPNRIFQSVAPFNHYQKPIQNAKYIDNKNKRRLAVQSHINSIKSNLKSQQYHHSGCHHQYTPNTTTTRSTPIPYSSYSTHSHYPQSIPPLPVLPQLPPIKPIKPIKPMNIMNSKPIQSIQPIQQRTVNRLPPRYYQSRNNHYHYVSNLNIRSNPMRYPKNVIIAAKNGDCNDYQTILKDYIYNEDDDNNNKLKYGEARLSEIINIKNIIRRPRNNEYENVSERFLKYTNLNGLSLDVIKIYKIRNDKLLDDYKHRKESIRRGLDNDLNKLNEKCLYHGTSINVIPKIITQGFLRQFTTRHAFGQGCYFAVNAAYSTHPRYATPNNQGLQFIFVCSVICGEFCKGNASMKVPDIKPNTNNILYETTCNDEKKPTVFVTFNDNQAIPRYLIVFKNNNLKISNA